MSFEAPQRETSIDDAIIRQEADELVESARREPHGIRSAISKLISEVNVLYQDKLEGAAEGSQKLSNGRSYQSYGAEDMKRLVHELRAKQAEIEFGDRPIFDAYDGLVQKLEALAELKGESAHSDSMDNRTNRDAIESFEAYIAALKALIAKKRLEQK